MNGLALALTTKLKAVTAMIANNNAARAFLIFIHPFALFLKPSCSKANKSFSKPLLEKEAQKAFILVH
jgi:hypothetical protein